MYMLRLRGKTTSQFSLLLADTRAYARPDTDRFLIADWRRDTREIIVMVPAYDDCEYITRDLTHEDRTIGAYNRVRLAIVTHVTNDEACDCTPCQEGGLRLV